MSTATTDKANALTRTVLTSGIVSESHSAVNTPWSANDLRMITTRAHQNRQVDNVPNLRRATTHAAVRQNPHGLTTNIEVARVLHQPHHRGNDVSIDQRLDLSGASGCDLRISI